MIRNIKAADLSALVGLHRDVFQSEAWDRRDLSEILAMPVARGVIAVGEKATPQLLGFAVFSLVAEDAELLSIGVHPEARRCGVATELMYHFFATSAAAGAHQALLEVATDNRAAQLLYSKLGFHRDSTRPNYYRRPGNKHVSAHLLRRSLLDGF